MSFLLYFLRRFNTGIFIRLFSPIFSSLALLNKQALVWHEKIKKIENKKKWKKMIWYSDENFVVEFTFFTVLMLRGVLTLTRKFCFVTNSRRFFAATFVTKLWNSLDFVRTHRIVPLHNFYPYKYSNVLPSFRWLMYLKLFDKVF